MAKLHSITLVVKPEQKLNIKWPRQHIRQVITLLTSFYLVCSSVSISAQHASLIFEAELAHELQECSGLIALENGKYFLAHNDSGCEPILYLISQDAKIIHQIRVEGSSHVDWEDMSFDGMKHLYIADCGNNDQSRRGGVINRIDISKGFFVDTVFAEQIKFQFGDYPTTKMKRNKKHFDIEAICTSGDSILMFTKNRDRWFCNKTFLYLLIPNTKQQKLLPIQSLHYGNAFFYENQISGAWCGNSTDQVYLTSASQLILLQNQRSGSDTLSYKLNRKYTYTDLSQKEAVCILEKNKVAVCQESNAILKSAAVLRIYKLSEK